MSDNIHYLPTYEPPEAAPEPQPQPLTIKIKIDAPPPQEPSKAASWLLAILCAAASFAVVSALLGGL